MKAIFELLSQTFIFVGKVSMPRGSDSNGQKGCGFIQPDTAARISPSISRRSKAGFTSLVEGAMVTFDIVPHKGKESAENLKVT